MMCTKFNALSLSLILFFSTAVNATVFFVDDFSYPNGQLTDSMFMDAVGDNVSGGLWQAHSGDGFNDNVAVIDGQAQLLNSGSEDVNRAIGATMGAGDKWYYGARVKVNFTGAPGDEINNDYFIHFRDDSFGFRGRVYLDDPADAGNDYTLGLSATSGGQAAAWPSDLTFGEAYNIIVGYDYDSGESTLWVDPVDAASTSIMDTGGEMTAISTLGLRQDFIGGTANNEILVDAVAAGSDFNAVLRSIVPEPTGNLLFVVAGLCMIARARRR